MRFRLLHRASFSVIFFALLGFYSAVEAQTKNDSTPPVQILAVGPIQMTVGDMDRSIDFYSRVLNFKKTSDAEIAGDDVEHLFNVFGARVRVVGMKLGDESIELVQ